MANRSAYEYFTKNVRGRKECLYYLGRAFSGEETVALIDAVASFLLEKGIGKGDVVAINLPNTPECIFTIYAVNKLGAVAYVTHPLLPVEALRKGIKESGAKMLVAMDTLSEDVGVPTVLCDGVGYLPLSYRIVAKLRRGVSKAKGERFPYDRTHRIPLAPQGTGEDIALYLPSGGTTGEPKIIRVTNEAFNQNADATLTLAKMPLEGHGVLLALPFFHGFGLSSSLHGAVSGGAVGVILPFLDYKKAAEYVKSGRVEIILAVPNMYKKLLAEKDFREGIGNMLLAFSGGDTLPERVKKEYDDLAIAAGGTSRLYQGYGLAETVSVCVANSPGEDKIGTIGKPVFADVKILDEKGKELPQGEKGEIAVKTPCMMKGYLGQEDFADEYLLTGDLGYFDEEGFLVFSGRKKRIIVIGGMNVYPLEIERTACELDFVTAASAEEYHDGEKPRICLFISDNSEFSEEKKREITLSYLSTRIIRYALPTKVVFLDKLPLTPVGKIDHLKLSKMLVDQSV